MMTPTLPMMARLPSRATVLATAFLLASILAALFVSSADAAVFDKSSGVKILSSRNFKKIATQSKYSTVVVYYANWCGHCKQLGPEYVVAAQKLKGMAVLGAVDCDVEKGLCSDAQVKGFPTVIGYFSDKSLNAKISPYNGPRTSGGIVSFIKKNTPNIVPQFDSYDAVLSTFLQAGNKDTSKIIIRKGKKQGGGNTSTHSTIKHMALTYHNKIKIAEVVGAGTDKTEIELILPNQSTPIKYVPKTGKYDYEHLKAFVVSTIKKAGASSSGADAKAKKNDKKDKKSSSSSSNEL